MAEVGQETHLDFQQAMQDFKTMFPEMDSEVIEAVLRVNRGAVHATIDQLLTMATDIDGLNPCQELNNPMDHPSFRHGLDRAMSYEQPPAYALSATPPPSYHQAVPSPNRSPACKKDEVDGARGNRYKSKWHPPILLPLPNDFLRIHPPPLQDGSILSRHHFNQRLNENALAREAVGESDAELVRYLKDERIALFLQNDEFINELRSNPEFMNSLQMDHGDIDEDDIFEVDGASALATTSISASKSKILKCRKVLAPLDDATLKERIATMGKASRKKFAQIASMFSRNKRSSFSRSLIAPNNLTPNPMSNDPLIEDEPEELNDQDSIRTSPNKLKL